MLEDELGLWIGRNPWVSTFSIVEPAGAEGRACVRLGLSPEGHDFLRDHGFTEFEETVYAGHPKDSEPPFCELASVTSDPGLARLFQPAKGFPRAVSWLRGKSDHRLLLDVSTELFWFPGHFAGQPVLPGVVQLHWAACAAQLLFGHGEPPRRVHRLKFKRVVIPPRIVELRLDQPQPGEVQFGYSSQSQVHSEGRMKFSEKGPC